MRRAVLAAVAVGIVVMWGFVPYGQKSGGEYQIYGDGSFKLGDGPPPKPEELLLLPPTFLGKFGPLYPAVQAVLLLIAPAWFAGRRRWVCFVEGILLLLSLPATVFAEDWSLSTFMWGISTPPRRFPPYWLIPGATALAGLIALAIGIAPKSRCARFMMG